MRRLLAVAVLAVSCASSLPVYYGEAPPSACRVVGNTEVSALDRQPAIEKLRAEAEAAGADAVAVVHESWEDYVGPPGTGIVGGLVFLRGDLLSCP